LTSNNSARPIQIVLKSIKVIKAKSPSFTAAVDPESARNPLGNVVVSKKAKKIEFHHNDLYVLLSFAKRTLVTRGALPTSPILQPIPYDISDNAKYEQIACLCLKPRYSGNPNDLIPTLNVIHIRHQNEAWYSATFLLQGNASIDLVQNFSQVEKSAVEARCKHW
jgi:hypothetical protein